jgi:hypothetical protein
MIESVCCAPRAQPANRHNTAKIDNGLTRIESTSHGQKTSLKLSRLQKTSGFTRTALFIHNWPFYPQSQDHSCRDFSGIKQPESDCPKIICAKYLRH